MITKGGLLIECALLREDLECVHMYLDDKKIPRKDTKGRDYSIVGRIKRLEKQIFKEFSDRETELLNKALELLN